MTTVPQPTTRPVGPSRDPGPAPRPQLSDRLGAACGAAYVLLIIVGNQITSGSETSAHPTGKADLAELSESPSLSGHIGFAMELLGFLAFMFFIGWFVHSLRQRGGASAWLAGVAGVAGVTTLSVKLASAMPVLAGQVDHKELSPGMARVLEDMNGSAFVVTFLPFAVLVLAGGLAILASGWLGRVAGWTAVVIGVLGLVVPLVTGLDPVTTNPMPFLAGLLWLLVVSVRLTWVGPRPARPAPATTTSH